MFNIDIAKLQSIANSVGAIAQAAAEAFDPALAPTIAIARQVVTAATDVANNLGSTPVDQTTLQSGLQTLIDKVEAHAKATEASLGPDA